MFFCYSCLTGFSANNAEETRETCERLGNHSEICKTHKAQRVTYPTAENDILKFTNIQKSLPSRIYGDFEAALHPTADDNVTTGLVDDANTPLPPHFTWFYLPSACPKGGERTLVIWFTITITHHPSPSGYRFEPLIDLIGSLNTQHPKVFHIFRIYLEH